jgi:hypothetical protein
MALLVGIASLNIVKIIIFHHFLEELRCGSTICARGCGAGVAGRSGGALAGPAADTFRE